MTAHSKYLASLLTVFSTFLESHRVSNDLAVLTTEFFVVFISNKKNYRDWSMTELKNFLEAQNVPHKSALLLKKFLKEYTPHEVDIFLHEFLSALKLDNKSESTIKNYRSDIQQFVEHSQKLELTSLFKPEVVRNFVTAQQASGLKKSTIKRKIISISQFAAWAESEHILEDVSFWISDIDQILDKKQKKTTPAIQPLASSVKTQPASKTSPLPQETLEKYLLSLEVDGHTPATIKNYKSDIQQFIDQNTGKTLSELITEKEITKFVTQQKREGLKTSTIKRKISSISQFALWCESRNLIASVGNWIDSLQHTVTEPQVASVNKQTTSDKQEKNSSFKLKLKEHGFVHAHQDTKRHSTWTLPTPGFTKTHSISKPQKSESSTDSSSNTQSADVFAGIRSNLSDFANQINTKRNRLLLPYINLALLLIFVIGLGYLGYQQFITQAPAPLAFPSSPVRPNRELSFQGRLTDTAQNPITTATDMAFRLYDNNTGGTQLWSSGTCSVTPDQDGIFNVGLGDDCGSEITEDVFTENSNVWLEVEVDSETLDPRQSIKTVPYALNSETVQGYPVTASGAATVNTILTMDSGGNVVLGEVSPTLRATSGTFAIEAQTLSLQTSSGSNGDILLSPDGTGTVIVQSNLDLEGYLSAPGATFSATYAGGIALIAKGGPSGTANIQEWQNSAGTALTVVDENGNIGVGTTNPGVKLEIADGNDGNGGIIWAKDGGAVLMAANGNYPLQIGNNTGGANSVRFRVAENGKIEAGGTSFYPNATDPGYSFWGDSDTGFFSPGSNILGIVTNGTERIRIDTNGNVGIGSTSPGYALDLVGEFNLTDAIRVSGNAGGSGYLLTSSGGGAMTWTDPASLAASDLWANTLNVLHPKDELASIVDLVIGGNSTASANIHLQSNGLAYFGGNVGIGTSSPSQALEVDGITKVGNFSEGYTTGYGIITNQNIKATGYNVRPPTVGDGTFTGITSNDGGNTNLSIWAGNAQVAEFDGYGNSADTVLRLGSNFNPTSGSSVKTILEIDQVYSTSGSYNGGAIGIDYNPTITSLTGTHYAALFRSGQVGIGTSTPAGLFDVTGSVTGQALVQLQENGDQDILVASNSAGTTRFRVANNGFIYGERFADVSNSNFYIDPAGSGTGLAIAGNAGIGTSTANYKLQVQGGDLAVFDAGNNPAILLGDNSTSPNYGNIIWNSAGDYFDIFTSNAGTGQLVLRGSGNVGIGTFNPAYDLDLVGDFNLDGAIYTDGDAGTSGYVLTSSGGGVNTWTDPSTLGLSYWANTNNVLHPKNEYAEIVDVAVGGTSTASANILLQSTGQAYFGGNVGIGSNTPAYKVDIDGDVRIANGQVLIPNGTVGAPAIAFDDGSADTGIYNDGGSLTITRDGAERLQVGPADIWFGYDLTSMSSASGPSILDASGDGAPVYVFRDDADSGIGQAAGDDTLALFTANAERVLIDANGNVGINSTTPGYELDLVGEFNLTDAIRVAGDAGTSGFFLTSSGGGANTWTDPSTITDSGWFDNTDNVLHPKNEYADVVDLVIGGNSTASADIHLQSNGQAYFAGNIGVGTSSPLHEVHIGGTTTPTLGLYGSSPVSTPIIQFGYSNTTPISEISHNVGSGEFKIGATAGGGHFLTFYEDGNERMRIDSNGNVGIGTTNPSSLLEVNNGVLTVQNDSTAAEIRLERVGTNYWRFLNSAGNFIARPSTASSDFSIQDSSSTALLFVQGSDGNVGIGTDSPSATLNVVGSVDLDATTITLNDTNLTTTITLTDTDTDFDSGDTAIVDAINTAYNAATGGGGSAIWTDTTPAAGSGLIYATAATDDFAVGGNSLAAPFSVDESANTVRIGQGTGSDATLNMFASDGDTGSLTYTTNDSWNFSGGNVGVGTSNPGYSFEIDGNGFANNWFVENGGRTGNINSAQIQYRSGSSGEIGFFTNSSSLTEQMTIDAAGNVGIGTTDPEVKLDIVGSNANQLRIRNTTADTTLKNAYIQVGNYTNSEEDVLAILAQSNTSSNTLYLGGGSGSLNAMSTIQFYTATGSNTLTGTERMRIASDGNVGIGSVNPSRLLNVNSTSDGVVARFQNTTNSQNGIEFQNGTNLWEIGQNSSEDFRFRDVTGGTIPVVIENGAASDTLYVADTDNVGIGTNNPAAKLHVEGSELRIKNGTGVPYLTLLGRNTDGRSELAFRDNTGATDNTKLVGLTNQLAIETNGSEAVRINADGNVGIGTDSPVATLNVVGSVDLDATTITLNDTNLTTAITLTDTDTDFDSGDTAIVDAINTAYSAATGGGSGIWTDTTPGAGSGIVYATDITDDFVIGSTTLTAPFSVDESTNTVRIGEGSGSNATLNMFASDGDTGSLTYTTNDSWNFSGGNIGIGTASPQGLLDVVGAVTGQALVQLQEMGDQDIFTASNSAGTTRFRMANNGYFYAERFADVSNSNWYLDPAGSGTGLAVAGNAGIGTSTANYKLHVVGEGNFTDAIRSNGDAGTSGYLLTSSGGGAMTWTDPTTLTGSSLWAETLNVFHPADSYAEVADLVIGGTSTASANIQLKADGTGYFGGNVGIGTTNAIAELQVQGGTTSDILLTNNVTGNTTDDGLWLGIDSDLDGYLWNEENGDLWFGTNDTARMIIFSSGNVGIGTTSDPTEALYVSGNGDIFAEDDITATDEFRSGTNGSAADPKFTWSADLDTGIFNGGGDILGFATGGNEAFRADANGNIGIGTTSPQTKLNLEGATTGQALAIFNETGDQDIFAASASGTTRVRITNDGDILPGTDDSQNLGSSTARWQDLYLGPASLHIGTDGNEGIISYDTTSNYLGFDPDADSTNEFVILDNGNVGIGTDNPSDFLVQAAGDVGPDVDDTYSLGSLTKRWQNLYVSGNIIGAGLWDADEDTGIQVEESTDEDYIRFDTAGSERMVIDNTGNIGIGTDSPVAELDITGRVKFDNGSTAEPTISFDANDSMGLYASSLGGGFMIFASGSQDRYWFSSNYLQSSNSTSFALQRAAGGATDPVYTFYNDEDTGLARATTNELTLVTDGSERIRVNSVGNVGIGSTTPQGLLDVTGAATGQALVQLQELGDQDILTASNSAGTTRFRMASNGYFYGERFVDVSNSNWYLDPAAAGTSLTVVSNVGIGTSAPDHELHIYDSGDTRLTFENTDGDGHQWSWANDWGGHNGFSLIEEGVNGDTIFFEPGGNIGIDTTDPSNKLELAGGNFEIADSAGDALGIIIGDGSDSSGINLRIDGAANEWQWEHYTSPGIDYLVIDYGGSNGNVLVPSGNLGVGTASPGQAIDVSGLIRATNNIQSGYGSGGVAMTINDGYGNANLTFNHMNGIPEQTGNAARIEVNTDSTSGSIMHFELGENVTGGVATGLTNIMTLAYPGNVGIGSTNPGQKLVVDGNVQIGAGGYIDDDATMGENNDDWIRLNGYIELKSNTANYGIVLRENDTSNYFGITQVNGYSYLTDTNTYSNYFIRGNGADAQVRGRLGIATYPSYDLDIDANLTGSGFWNIGANIDMDHTSGTGTYYIGLNVDSYGTVSNKNVMGTRINTNHSSYGSVGAYISAGSASIGYTPANHYGILVGGEDYGVYSTDGLNYFADDIIVEESVQAEGHFMVPKSTSANNIIFNKYNSSGAFYFRNTTSVGGQSPYNDLFTIDNNGNATVWNRFYVDDLVGSGASGVDVRWYSPTNEMYYPTSSRRYKTDIVPIEVDTNKIYDLELVSFTPINNLGGDSMQREFGMIAEDTYEVIPELVYWMNGVIEGIHYDKLPLLTLGEVQKHQAQLVAIKGDLDLNSTGSVVLSKEGNQYVVRKNATNQAVTRTGTLADLIVARIKAGLITTEDLVVKRTASIKNLSAETITINGQSLANYIASVVGGQSFSGNQALVSPLGDDTIINIASDSGQIAFNTANDQTVTTISDSGDISTLGSLLAQEVTTTNLTASGSSTLGSLLVTQDATVAGTLTANNTSLGSLLAAEASVSGSLTVAQDATVAGTLIAGQIDATSSRIAALEAGMAQLENLKATTAELTTATVSGTLYADNIYDFENKIATSLQQPGLLDLLLGNNESSSSADPLAELYDTVNATELNASSAAELDLSLADLTNTQDDVIITGTALFIEKYFKVNGAGFVSDSLAVGNSLFVGDSTEIRDGVIAYNTADPDNQVLQIQPSGQGSIELLAGLVTLDDSGTVTVNGDFFTTGNAKIAGTLLTDLIQPTEFGNPLQVQVAGVDTQSNEVKKSRFEIINEVGAPVATFSAQGDAEFTGSVKADGGLKVASQILGSSDTNELTANKTSGKATIKSGANEVVIKSELITDDTLVYVTAVGSTNNQVLYVKAQTPENTDTSEKEGQFTVGFDDDTTSDVTFNWWIVN